MCSGTRVSRRMVATASSHSFHDSGERTNRARGSCIAVRWPARHIGGTPRSRAPSQQQSAAARGRARRHSRPQRCKRRDDVLGRDQLAVVQGRRPRPLVGREPRRSPGSRRPQSGRESSRSERRLRHRPRRRQQPADRQRDCEPHRVRRCVQLLEDRRVRHCHVVDRGARGDAQTDRNGVAAPGRELGRLRRGDHLVQARPEPPLRRSRPQVLRLPDQDRCWFRHLCLVGGRWRLDPQGRDRQRLRLDQRQGWPAERLHDPGRRHLPRQEQRVHLATRDPEGSVFRPERTSLHASTPVHAEHVEHVHDRRQSGVDRNPRRGSSR